MNDVTIRRNDDAGRYELLVDDRVASFTEFHDDGTVVVMPHTVTLRQHRDQGLAARVVQFALDDIRSTGRTVVPTCWFVAEFIDSHPEYKDLLA